MFVGRERAGSAARRVALDMAADPVVFALANPDPEVDVDAAQTLTAVIATGRSDYPNQINNVLAFPGVFRGLLDARARQVTHADAAERGGTRWPHCVSDEQLNATYIVPERLRPGGACRGRGRGPRDRSRVHLARCLSVTRTSAHCRLVYQASEGVGHATQVCGFDRRNGRSRLRARRMHQSRTSFRGRTRRRRGWQHCRRRIGSDRTRRGCGERLVGQAAAMLSMPPPSPHRVRR